MQNAELRELTASEELTLEQEYAMQRKFPAPPLSRSAQREMEVNRKLAGRRGQCVAILVALIALHLIYHFLLVL